MTKLSETLYALKAKLEGFAAKPYASLVLFCTAFIEASIFPIPPDILLIALSVAQPRRSFVYGAICVGGSVAGAILGYAIGYAFFETIGHRVVSLYGFADQFQVVLDHYRENAWTAIIVAGFTPIPFMLFTIAAGFGSTVNLTTFVFASLAGRLVRFLLVAALLFVFGPKVKEYLERYLQKVTFAVGLLFVLGLITLKWLL